MPDEDLVKKAEKEVKQNFFHHAKAWGQNSVPPTALATLIFAQHARPFQALPMLFPPILLGSSFLNLHGYKSDAAGISASWSGLYMLLASRRKHRVRQMLGTRGILRGATFVLAAVNLVAGWAAYAFGDREAEAVQRQEMIEANRDKE